MPLKHTFNVSDEGDLSGQIENLNHPEEKIKYSVSGDVLNSLENSGIYVSEEIFNALKDNFSK